MKPTITMGLILLAAGGVIASAGWRAGLRNPFSVAPAVVLGGLVTIAAGAALLIFGLL